MSRTLRFDCFEVDPATHRLLKRGLRIRLREQSFQVLLLLLTRAGQVVTREDIRQRLWASDTFVNFENSLNTAVARLREALGDSAEHPRYVETLPRVGYRFIGEVSEGRMPESPPVLRARMRLMVLPFVNSSGDPALEYFSDAITDEVTTELAALAPEALGVIARTTAMHYKSTADDVSDIARRLGLDWILEGAARRAGDRVVLTAQLIRTGDQTHVMARRYEGRVDGLFDIERAVAEEVGEQIGATQPVRPLSPEPAVPSRRRRKPTDDPVAHDCYIRGRHCLERGESPQSWAQARQQLEAALARDPRFALAHDGLAEYWWNMGFFGLIPPRKALPLGMAHARLAVEIDAGLAEAHAMLAQFRKQYEFDWNEVADEMAIALRLDPNSPIVRRRRAFTGLMPLGRLDEAIHELDIALDLDPLGLLSRAWLLVLLWLSRQYDRALEQARLLLEIEPGHFLSHLGMGFVGREVGLVDDGMAGYRKAVELTGGSPLMLGWLGLALAQSGDTAGARTVLSRLGSMPAGVFVPPTSVAWIHLGLGEIDEFFQWMHCAIEVRDQMITPIMSYPFMDPIRDDPRYDVLLRKMNLA